MTRTARLPGLIVPSTGDRALDRWIGAATERFQAIEAAQTVASTATNASDTSRTAGVVVNSGSGQQVLSFDAFAESIRHTKLYTDLTRRIDDPSRFDDLHERTRAVLLADLAPITGEVAASIRRVEEQVSTASESFAQTVDTLQASVRNAAAGVRQVRFASANENRATAGIVTTITARLNNFTGGAAGTATVESKMTAIADRSTGLEAQYTLKVTAGGAMAGYGVAATTNASGNATSAFIIQADKFAIVSSSYAGGLTTTPDVTKVPFGIDGTGIYMTGNVRIDGSLLVGTVTATNLSAATGTFSGSLSAATGTFAGSLSAATGTFAGSISAASGTFTGSLNIAGTAVIDGNNTALGGTAALVANTGYARLYGVIGYGGTSLGSGGIAPMAVRGIGNGGIGVQGEASASGMWAVRAIATGAADGGLYGYSGIAASPGVYALNFDGGIGLRVTGDIKWGSVTWVGGPDGTTKVLAANGTWSTVGNASGNIPLSNGTVNTNDNADMVDGYHAGNSSGQVAVSNGSVCTNLNAQFLQGNTPSNFATSAHTHAAAVVDSLNIFNITTSVARGAQYSTDGGSTWTTIQLKFN